MLRKNELRNALSLTKVVNVFYLDILDKTVVNNQKRVVSFDFSNYDYVFVPNRNENHPDHEFAFRYIKKAINKYRTNLLEYEIWTPMSKINCFLDISNVFNIKMSMVEMFKTQIISNDYRKLVKGLNLYRGALLHKEFVECFFLTPKKNHYIKNKIIKTIKRLSKNDK